MAELNLDIVIENAQAAQSVGEIRKQLKELRTAMLQVGEGSEDFERLAMAVFAFAIAALVTALYKVYKARQDANSELEKATREYEKQKEITAELVREKQQEIELLEAQGASTEQVIEAKRALIAAQIAEAEATIKVNELKVQEVRNNESLWESLLRVADVVNGTNQAEAAIAQNKKERKRHSNSVTNYLICVAADLFMGVITPSVNLFRLRLINFELCHLS